MKNNPLRSNCPINYALECLGDKWALLVIRDLVFEGKRFYKEFLDSNERIATNILSDRLKKLENLGIIESKTYEKQKTQKIYSLTPKGEDLIPILVEMIEWSSKHKDGLHVSAEFVQKLRKSKSEIITAIRSNIGKTTFSANASAG